ncbi:hypothetical protein [Kribbella swartbergensis]
MPEATRYRVVAPYVTVRTSVPGAMGGRGGAVVLGFYRDNWLPLDVDEATIRHLLGLAMIEPVNLASPPPERPPAPTDRDPSKPPAPVLANLPGPSVSIAPDADHAALYPDEAEG